MATCLHKVAAIAGRVLPNSPNGFGHCQVIENVETSKNFLWGWKYEIVVQPSFLCATAISWYYVQILILTASCQYLPFSSPKWAGWRREPSNVFSSKPRLGTIHGEGARIGTKREEHHSSGKKGCCSFWSPKWIQCCLFKRWREPMFCGSRPPVYLSSQLL